MADPALFGRDLFGEIVKPPATGPVAERFLFPPFSVLDARQGEWQERKRAWHALGLRAEVARKCEGANAWNDLSLNPRVAESTKKIAAVGDGPTVFDPVVCELAYRWWSPETGTIVDPFAGGAVRGVVAALLGRSYWGGELRAEQVEENRKQALTLCSVSQPVWSCGDSRETLRGAPTSDFVFSCPPYGDLERYSDDPADLSAMAWPQFLEAYREIVRLSVASLRADRFACFVVGDFRDRAGLYRNFVSETIGAFHDAGARLYNEAILVGAVGSASMRVSRQFAAGRKLCKLHQNVLVFVKGDPMRAAKLCEAA
jgi:hypothetical protein